MSSAVSRFRVSTSAFIRPYEDAKAKVLPRFVYFLSVEGDNTEYDYFKHLDSYLRSIYPQSRLVISIQTPQHSGLSSPDQVYELLEQCENARKPVMVLKSLSKQFRNKYGKKLTHFFDPVKVTQDELAEFKRDLETLEIRYDIVNLVRKFGTDDGNCHPEDHFGMVIDRDRLSHTDKNRLLEIFIECSKKKFKFCLSNPCFELWLLLHKVDISCKFTDAERRNILVNKKEGDLTYIGCLIKKRFSHGKSISELAFEKYYKKNIGKAIERQSRLETKMPALLDKLGTNVGELVQELISLASK